MQSKSESVHDQTLSSVMTDGERSIEDQEMITVSSNKDALDAQQICIEAKEMALQAQAQLDQKKEPVEVLADLNLLLNTHYREINQFIASDAAMKSEFYKIVFKQTADKLLQEKQLSQQGYLQRILRFFRNIIVNFFPFDIESENLSEVIHSLFNLDQPLYTLALQTTYKKQINQDPVNLIDSNEEELTLDQRRIKQEYQWRQQLKPGDQLDAVMVRQVMSSRIQHWARATVCQVEELSDQIMIQFENEPSMYDRKLARLSPDLAYPNTFTEDFDWRYQIATDDLVDSLDSEAIWYKSTILNEKLEAFSGQEKESKQVYVGYRFYSEEEGHKVDDDGRKFVGWSNRYDEWITVTSPQIQKLGTVCKFYKAAGKMTMQYDHVVDDLQDVLFNTKERKVWAVFRSHFFSNLRCIPDYFNEFGARGGFERILHFFSRPEQSKTSMRHLFYLIEFLNKSQPLWHRQFQCYYIPQIREAFEKILLYTSPEGTGAIQMKFNKESLSGIQKAFQGILRRFYTSDCYQQIMAELSFNLGFSLLKSEKLEQRVQGLKEIVEQVKSTMFTMRKSLSIKQVLQRLQECNIFETIFGDNYHIQLIQRSQEIIKFYIDQKTLTEKEIDQIWQVTKKDQQTKMEIYKIISEIAIKFNNDQIEMLVQRFAEVPPEQFVEKEVECVYELSKYSYKQATFSVRAAQLFWDIAVQQRPYKKQIIEMAIDKFIDIVRNWDRDQKGEFIYQAIEKILEHKSSVQCLKIIQKILDQIPNYRINNQPTLTETTQRLIQDADLINNVIFDLAHYSEKVNDLWAKEVLNEQNIEGTDILDLPFSHRAQSFTRLNFIRQMLQNSSTQIGQEQLDQIWDLMMVRSKISIDSDIFFNWFKMMLNDNNKLSPSLIVHFFQTKVCGTDVSFKYIKKAGFDCICNIFLQINEQEDMIQVLQMPTANSQKLDFKVHVAPMELIGIDVLWKLLSECDKKNLDLTAAVIDLITKAYHNLSPNLQKQVIEIQDQFCQESLQRLKRVITDETVTEEEKNQIVNIITVMMKSFFKDCEKNGLGDMKTHSSFERGPFIERVIIQNNVTHQKNTPRYIEFSVYSNMTVWQLKKIVATKIKQSPLRIQFQRSDTKKKAITDQDHLVTLRELRVENYELIYVQKKALVFMPRVSLLTKKKELVPEVRAIFESWFKKFSNEEGFMTPETCVEFIRSSTQDLNVLPTDSRIVRLFNDYDNDIDGKITLEDFLNFYKDRSINKQDLVWSNLNQHGYGNDLKPQSSQYLPDDPNEITNPSLLPRFKLGNDQAIFEEIFSFFQHVPKQAQDDLWSLIQNVRTNSRLFSDILSLKHLDCIFTSQSIHKVLYCLQLIEHFINEYQIKSTSELKCYYQESQDYNQNFPSLDQDNQSSSNLSPEKMTDDKLNDQIREQQSSAPQSGVIALPPAPAEDEHVKTGGSIPSPPHLQVPFIGPVPPPMNNNNQTNNVAASVSAKLKEMLDNYQGQVICEKVDDSLISDREIAQLLGLQNIEEVNGLKSNWIKNFIYSGGFTLLQNSLEKIINLNENKQDQQVLASKGEKECLQQSIKLMKILLMSSFIANIGTAELGLELTRKMSSKGQQENFEITQESLFEAATSATIPASNPESTQVEAKKSAIQIEQEDTEKIYEPLIKALSGEHGLHIIHSIDFKVFQEQILKIILIVLKRQERLILDDKVIVDQALSLWISVIIYNSDLLQFMYDNQQQANESDIIFNKLIEYGMFCANYAIRESFRDHLKVLFQCVKTQTLSPPPYIFFLGVLLENVQMSNFRSNESRQYFQTLRMLLVQYNEAEKNKALDFQKTIDQQEQVHDFIAKLKDYESREKKGQYREDSNLVGYINIIQELIQNDASLLSIDEYRDFLIYLVEKCLFTTHIEPLCVNITKEIDIINHERPFINKCLTPDSRNACYKLLQTICEINPELTAHVIKNQLWPLVSQIHKPKKANFAPRFEGRSYHGFCGLKNLGAICYMIAMIQQLYHVPTFRYMLLAGKSRDLPNSQEFEGDMVEDNMLYQMIKLMGFMELTERQDYNLREFCFSFKGYDGLPTNVRIQQDSYEFLTVLFGRIENMLAKSSIKYLLQGVFGGQITRLMICQGCGYLSQSYEEFPALSLEVKNQKSIYDGLRKFISGEIINDFRCEACQQKVDVMRKSAIESLPNMLIVHLQRLYFDMDTFTNQKLNSRVEFPNVLNMKPFMINEVLKQEKDLMKKAKKDKRRKERYQQHKSEEEAKMKQENEEGKNDENLETAQMIDVQESPEKQIQQEEESSDDEVEAQMDVDQPEEDFQYKLVGVVVHMGTADAGHYISYININRGVKDEESPEWLQTEKEKWLEFNDSTVKEYKFTNLDEDCFGGAPQSNSHSQDFSKDHSKNAYLLLYEKRRKQPIKVVVPKAFVSQSQSSSSLGCDGTAMSRGTSQEEDDFARLLSVCPQIQELMKEPDAIKYDEERNEHILKIQFNSAQKFVPNDIYKLVHEDNYRFMCERQIFSNPFFEAMKNLLTVMIDKSPNVLFDHEHDSQKLFDFTYKLIFDLSAMTSENKHLLDLTKNLLNMLNFNDQQLMNVVNDFVLVDKSKLEKDEKGFFESLISNSEKDVREMNAMILTFVVNRLFALKNMDTVDTLMNQAFALFPDDLSKYWLKLHQYLTFLLEVTKSGYDQASYMIKNNLISKLIDFFLENESPRAVGKKRQAMGSNYANPPFEPLILLISVIVRSYHYVDLGGSVAKEGEVSPQYMKLYEERLPPLSEEDRQMLSLKQFYTKNLKSGFQKDEFGRIIAHLMYGNYDFSKKISKRVLIGVNKASSDELEPYLHALVLIFLVNDRFMPQRFEWLLGIPQLKVNKPAQFQGSQSQQRAKVGVSNLDAASDDVFDYKSTLFKSSQSIKESLLQIIFQYRKKWTKFSLNCLNALLQAGWQDLSRSLARYLRNLEPPNYTYARYIDWVRPYLEDQAFFLAKNLNIQSTRNEFALCQDLLNYYDMLFGAPQQPAIPSQEQEASNHQQQNKVIQHNSAEGGPEQYLIWEVLDERVVNEINLFDNQLAMYVTEYQVKITESKPDGHTNQVFSPSLFSYSQNRGETSYNYGETGNRESEGNFQRRKGQYGRGLPTQWQVEQKNGHQVMHAQGRKAPQRTSKKKKKYTVVSQSAPQQDEMVQDRSNNQDADDYNVNIDNYKSSGESSMEVEYNDDNFSPQDIDTQFQDYVNNDNEKQNVYSDLEQIDTTQNYDQENQNHGSIHAKVAPQDAESDPKLEAPSAVPSISVTGLSQTERPQNSQEQDQINQEVQMVNQDQSNQIQDSWEAPVWSVLVFTVRNFNQVKGQTIVLKLNDTRESELQQQNFYFPQSPITALVMGDRERDVLVLTKLKPFEEWGNFSYSLEIVNQNQSQPSMTVEGPQLVETGVQGEGVVDYDDLMNAEMENQIQCPTCTLFNSPYLTQCEVCGSSLR